MPINIDTALLGLCVTLLSMLVGTVWRFSSLATELRSEIASLKEDRAELKSEVAELRRAVAALSQIPDMRRDLEQIQEVLGAAVSRLAVAEGEIGVLKSRLTSVAAFKSDLIRARFQSRPDVGANGADEDR